MRVVGEGGGHPFAKTVRVCAMTQTEVVHLCFGVVASFEVCQSDCVGVQQPHSPRELHPDKNTPTPRRCERAYGVFAICFDVKLG